MSESLADLTRYAETVAGQMADEAAMNNDVEGIQAAFVLALQGPDVRGLLEHVGGLHTIFFRPLPDRLIKKSIRPTLTELFLRHVIVLASSSGVFAAANEYFDIIRWQRPEIVCVFLDQWMFAVQREHGLHGIVMFENIQDSFPQFRELEEVLIAALQELANLPLSDLDARAELSFIWHTLRRDLALAFVHHRIVPINAYALAFYTAQGM
jgi:hypothetical protein